MDKFNFKVGSFTFDSGEEPLSNEEERSRTPEPADKEPEHMPTSIRDVTSVGKIANTLDELHKRVSSKSPEEESSKKKKAPSLLDRMREAVEGEDYSSDEYFSVSAEEREAGPKPALSEEEVRNILAGKPTEDIIAPAPVEYIEKDDPIIDLIKPSSVEVDDEDEEPLPLVTTPSNDSKPKQSPFKPAVSYTGEAPEYIPESPSVVDTTDARASHINLSKGTQEPEEIMPDDIDEFKEFIPFDMLEPKAEEPSPDPDESVPIVAAVHEASNVTAEAEEVPINSEPFEDDIMEPAPIATIKRRKPVQTNDASNISKRKKPSKGKVKLIALASCAIIVIGAVSTIGITTKVRYDTASQRASAYLSDIRKEIESVPNRTGASARVYDESNEYLTTVSSRGSSGIGELPPYFKSALTFNLVGTRNPSELEYSSMDKIRFFLPSVLCKDPYEDLGKSLSGVAASTFLGDLSQDSDNATVCLLIGDALDDEYSNDDLLRYIAFKGSYLGSEPGAVEETSMSVFGLPFTYLSVYQQVYMACAYNREELNATSFYEDYRGTIEVVGLDLPEDEIVLGNTLKSPETETVENPSINYLIQPVLNEYPEADLNIRTTIRSDVTAIVKSHMQAAMVNMIDLDVNGNYLLDMSVSIYETNGDLICYVPSRSDKTPNDSDKYIGGFRGYENLKQTLDGLTADGITPYTITKTTEAETPLSISTRYQDEKCNGGNGVYYTAFEDAHEIAQLYLSGLGVGEIKYPGIDTIMSGNDKVLYTKSVDKIHPQRTPNTITNSDAIRMILTESEMIDTAQYSRGFISQNQYALFSSRYIIIVSAGTRTRNADISWIVLQDKMREVGDFTSTSLMEIDGVLPSPQPLQAEAQSHVNKSLQSNVSIVLDAVDVEELENFPLSSGGSNRATFEEKYIESVELLKSYAGFLNAEDYTNISARLENARRRQNDYIFNKDGGVT